MSAPSFSPGAKVPPKLFHYALVSIKRYGYFTGKVLEMDTR